MKLNLHTKEGYPICEVGDIVVWNPSLVLYLEPEHVAELLAHQHLTLLSCIPECTMKGEVSIPEERYINIHMRGYPARNGDSWTFHQSLHIHTLVVLQNIAAAALRGEPIPEGEQFDSNCITPGTAFMGRLGAHLRFFIRKKMAEDPVWQQPKVIFSGRELTSAQRPAQRGGGGGGPERGP